MVSWQCWKLSFLYACVSTILGVSGKAWNLIASLNVFFIFFNTPLTQGSIKTSEKLRYRHLHNMSPILRLQIPRLDNLPLACQKFLHNKVVTDYNEIIKSKEFRDLSYNVCSKEVSLYFVKFVALVVFRYWKKAI